MYFINTTCFQQDNICWHLDSPKSNYVDDDSDLIIKGWLLSNDNYTKLLAIQGDEKK